MPEPRSGVGAFSGAALELTPLPAPIFFGIARGIIGQASQPPISARQSPLLG